MNQSRLNALRILLAQPEVSLLTLNAPHATMSGVIPLGMAAWLNQPIAVRALLDDGVDSVAVDGMDSHGATALMCTLSDFLQFLFINTAIFHQTLLGMVTWMSPKYW
jgi:hypothetical protein